MCLPAEMIGKTAGTFVSLHAHGQLRGCIGTTAPTTASIAWEIVQNAVSAGARDPRFYIKNRSTLDSFFSHYVSHRYEKPGKDNTEFRILKQYSDRDHMKDLLDDLAEKASYYRMFYCPEECDNIIYSRGTAIFLEE